MWNMQSTYMRPRPAAALYREAAAEARLAEDLGFDAVWTAEHHLSYDGYCPSPLAAAATLLAATRRVKVGVGVLVLPFHPAERVAEGCAALESIAPGRSRVAVGIGYRELEFAAAGLRVADRAPLTDERLDALITPPLADRLGGTEVWVGAGSLPGIHRAARTGSSPFLPCTVGPRALAELRGVWADGFTGRGGPPARFGTHREVWVDRDPRRVEWARGRLVEMWRHYAAFFVEDPLADADRRERLAQAYARTAVFGSPAEVVDGLGAIIDAGVDTLALRVRFDGVAGDDFARCAELLAADVLPQLRNAR